MDEAFHTPIGRTLRIIGAPLLAHDMQQRQYRRVH